MKTLTLIFTFALTACVTTTSPDGTKTTQPDLVTINALAALAVDVAADRLHISPDSARAIKAAAADLAGVAAQSQANVGKTPTASNVAQGAAIPAVGQAVQAQLPAGPIDQKLVNTIFAAAAATKDVQ